MADGFWAESSLRRAVDEFVTHYNQERNHQGLATRLIRPKANRLSSEGALCRRIPLGGLLNYYDVEATLLIDLNFWKLCV